MARPGNPNLAGPFHFHNDKEDRMRSHALALGLGAAALLALGACNKDDKKTSSGAPQAQTKEAKKIAGEKTIAAGLAPGSRFMATAKTAGLDQTLAGAGPYTVFVPDDAAFAAAPTGTFDAKPENRSQLTGVVTNLILQGTVLTEDIDKLIDRGKGKGMLATTGGGLLTATKDGGKIVLTDSTGHKATITQGDEQYSNGVVHHVDALLMPAKPGSGPAVGQKKGR
jgi:uncharacterized surface protein with fasciclin (FAS1) repeats